MMCDLKFQINSSEICNLQLVIPQGLCPLSTRLSFGYTLSKVFLRDG
jgi:hypothetical protein